MADQFLLNPSAPVASSSSPVVETQRELERVRREILSSAHDLRDDMKQMTDWRRPIRQRPWLFIGAALAVGFLAGTLHRSRSRT